MVHRGGEGFVDPLVGVEREWRRIVGEGGRLTVATTFFAILSRKV